MVNIIPGTTKLEPRTQEQINLEKEWEKRLSKVTEVRKKQEENVRKFKPVNLDWQDEFSEIIDEDTLQNIMNPNDSMISVVDALKSHREEDKKSEDSDDKLNKTKLGKRKRLDVIEERYSDETKQISNNLQ